METPREPGGAEGDDWLRPSRLSGAHEASASRAGYDGLNLSNGLGLRFTVVVIVVLLSLMALLVHSCARQKDEAISPLLSTPFTQSSTAHA